MMHGLRFQENNFSNDLSSYYPVGRTGQNPKIDQSRLHYFHSFEISHQAEIKSISICRVVLLNLTHLHHFLLFCVRKKCGLGAGEGVEVEVEVGV